MANPEDVNEREVESLWQKAKPHGVSRRHFMALLGTGGAAAVLAALNMQPTQAQIDPAAQQEQQTPTPTLRPTPTPQPTPTAGLHVKPVPEQYFIPHGTSIETRWERMADVDYRTPESLFFIRNHSATPVIDHTTWELVVGGPGTDRTLRLSYDDLLNLPSRTVTRFVECAGNARSLYDRVLDNPAEGTQWTVGGYGIATWTGVPLAEILDRAGLQDSAVSVRPRGLDEVYFRKPVPIDKATDDVMVVYGMNGAPLPRDHGFPARMLVPGWVGSYNVKWVGSIAVANQQVYTPWNTESYVLIGPEYADPPGPPEGEIIQEQTVKSFVALPWPATLEPGRQQIMGYAWSPYAEIARMEISTDDGESWDTAELFGPNIAAAGTQWRYTLDAEPGEMTLTLRATDEQGNSQWPVEEQLWNRKGYVWGAVIPHPVTVEG